MTRPIDFDGLVVEDDRGNRLLALPAAVLQELREATVVRYRRGDSVFSMRVANFADGRTGGQPATTQARDAMAPQVEPPAPAGSAPTPEYGAPDLPISSPSPTPPPPPEEEQDPANIPLRVKRGGHWTNVYVTREQYETYVAQGRISQEPPAEGSQP